tara:strand:+ start:5633 stop:6883 length:1251 start_codon:yes stop_codon:yes gene_type:complete
MLNKCFFERRRSSPFAIALLMLFLALHVRAEHWVSSWSASPQPLWDGNFTLDTRLPFHFWNQTVRQVARISLGGDLARIEISNRYGNEPLLIGAASFALYAGEGQLAAGTAKTLTFAGEPSVTVPVGASVLSDPLKTSLADLSEVAVDIYLPQPTAPATFHWDGLQNAYIASGNQTGAVTLQTPDIMTPRVFLSGILVDSPTTKGVVVAYGDSITDGNASTSNANHRWPDYLAAQLADKDIAVVNAGISGARLLLNVMGENALARFQQDVLGQPGVSSVIVLMGINDIGWPGSEHAPQLPQVQARDLINAYQQLIAQAHVHGVRIIGATLTPFKGALDETPVHHYYTEDKEKVRQTVNNWIRNSGAFDEVVDFDKLTRDPKQPSRMRKEYDSGDHLHPNDAGYKAMAEMVSLKGLI